MPIARPLSTLLQLAVDGRPGAVAARMRIDFGRSQLDRLSMRRGSGLRFVK